MFIVTNCTPAGNYTPSVFKTKEEANFYKFALAIIDAQTSSFGTRFEEELGEDYGVKLETLCKKYEEAIHKTVMEIFELTMEEVEVIGKFVEFLTKHGCKFNNAGAYINYSDDTYNYIEVFDVSSLFD